MTVQVPQNHNEPILMSWCCWKSESDGRSALKNIISELNLSTYYCLYNKEVLLLNVLVTV